MGKPTDTIRIFGGSIVTMDADDPVTGEVIVKGDHIVWTGRRGSVPAEYRKARAIDLKGRLLLPAFSDAHTHFLYFARTRNDIDLHGTTSLSEALRRIRTHAMSHKSSRWITGRGLDVNAWKTGWPSRHDLDRIERDRPIAIFTHDEHSVWCNSRALQIGKVDRQTPDPPGGRIGREESGEPSGVLYETADRLIWDCVPEPTPAQDERAVAESQQFAHRAGVAAINDMGGPATLRAFGALAAKDRLRLRLWKSIPLQFLEEAISCGLRSGLGDEWVKIGGVKIFLDGALGSQTAWLYRSYRTNKSSAGICRMPRADFDDAVRRATSHGFSVCVHAIGDAAVGQAIDVIAKHRHRFPVNQPPRIEHLQLFDPNDLAKLANSEIIASMQPSHLLTDRDIADKHWGARSRHAFALRTLWDCGVVMAFGSDMPIEPMSPLQGIGASVWRAKPNDRRGPWYRKQCLKVWEAVWGFTAGAAIASADQHQRGMIKPGYLADLVILDRNIFTIPPRHIFNAQVDMTMVAGEILHTQK